MIIYFNLFRNFSTNSPTTGPYYINAPYVSGEK